MAEHRLSVDLGERSYPIVIGAGILALIGKELKSLNFPRKVAVVTNSTVAGLYGEQLRTALEEAEFRLRFITIPDGEEYKTLVTLDTIFEELIRHGFDRSSGLLALGGGVVGDITGFAAATYLRGIPFAQVPTTLLAQVDSSVGGKTAVNHALGKNLVGAFYQPALVLADVATLATLPDREYAAGLAEVVKYGVIRDKAFFHWLQNHLEELRLRSPAALVTVVMRSCHIKADVVEIDEKESSLRAILNFGHSYGHAVETLSGYGTVRHGEAVALGMLVAAAVSRELGLCRQDELLALRDLLRDLGLPVNLPDLPLNPVFEVMARDKKVKDGVLRLIVNCGLGDCQIREIAEPKPLLAAALTRLAALQVAHGHP
jgi:3-dehydroquinate synthase